jgi:hypothetical protein
MIITRTGFEREDQRLVCGWEKGGEAFTGGPSGHADKLQFYLQRLVIERLHDIFVGPGADCFANMGNVIFRRAKYHLGCIAARLSAQLGDEFDSGHDWHIPIKQDHIGHFRIALFECELAIFCFGNRKIQTFQNVP